ncbi:tRNA threonylcarbamoyladenosine biosynthesis protein TsaB [Thermocrinis minervae]|nr:tRNA threonylcarbamoyladenosine biosynthesis protein TsaB [Thermocrinis minervae]
MLYYQDTGKKTLELLPSELKKHNVHPAEVDALAVSLGVGYFTSLRIGITFVKTWAYLYKKPVVGYENLKLMLLYSDVKEPKTALLRISNKTFAMSMQNESFSELFLLEEREPIGVTIGLANQKVQADVLLELFPFSFYGALWALEYLKENPEGQNPFLLEPIYPDAKPRGTA